VWQVRRRWFRRPRWRGGSTEGGWLDILDVGSTADSLPALAVIVGIVLVLGLFIFVVLPLLLLLGELVIVAAGAYVLGKPWFIEAETLGPPEELKVWRVRGWRRSRRAVDEVSRELYLGAEAEPADAERD
jgi:hypothetical protein